MTDSSLGEGAPQFLPELAGLILSEQTVSDLLDVIVNLAVSAVAGVDGASVSMVVRDDRRLETSNASSAVYRIVDEAQYERGKGPCVEAIRTGHEVTVTLPVRRWPEFSEQAVAAGMRSVWSLPLTVEDFTTGALNLYSSQAESWTASASSAARGLAAQAAVVLTNAATLSVAQMANTHLHEALESRDVIGQAKGILMARQSISADAAFDLLRRASQRSDRKLRDIAAEVVARLDPPPDGV